MKKLRKSKKNKEFFTHDKISKNQRKNKNLEKSAKNKNLLKR